MLLLHTKDKGRKGRYFSQILMEFHKKFNPCDRQGKGLCPYMLTPYNRLLRRQITASTTDQGNFSGKGVGEVFLFAKINKRICGLQLMMENIFNVWRYYSSNLTLFQFQISFLSAHQNLRFGKIA